jgi:heme exporter protein A
VTAPLSLAGVTLRRGGRLLFEGLDVELAPGDALRLTGPNGSGKSSLLRLAAGLLFAEAGRVERARPALADDKLALDPERPLADALRFWAGSNPDSSLAALGLEPLARVPVRYLSSGQAKRATLARVVASNAPLWLLDEPANALDADGVRRLGEAIAAHRSTGGAVVAASHVPLPGKWRTLELGR